MFNAPGQRYCWQLTEEKPVTPELKAQLPDYLFVERARPDYILTGPVPSGEIVEFFERRFGKGTYRLK